MKDREENMELMFSSLYVLEYTLLFLGNLV